MLKRKEFQKRVRQVIAYYAAGVGDGSYEAAMDDLTMKCSDAQWQAVTMYLDQAAEWLAETDRGTTYQKEHLLAKREGRRSRYPTAFEMGTPEADARIARLRAEIGGR